MSFDNYNSSFVDDDRAIVELMVFSNGIHDRWGDFEFEASTKTNWEYINDEWVIVEDIWEFQRWGWEITPFQP